MRPDSSHRLGAAVLRSESIEAAGCQRPFTRTIQPLPLYVEPAPEEALLSWLLRLATRLGVSFHALARQSFGIDDRSGHTQWWSRPHPWTLKRMSEHTGVSIPRLRRMTFEGFELAYRDDEAPARFAGRRYDSRAPEHRGLRFAVCGPCFKDDARPYLRKLWLLGWMAACPKHGTPLIERCEVCHAGVRAAPFATAAAFSPAACRRCGCNLLYASHVPVHPSILQMQAALLRGKCDGVTELAGLGRLSWKELVVLVDVWVGMVWTDLTLAEQQKVLRLYTAELLSKPPVGTAIDIYDDRQGSLRFLAWLTEGWPASTGAKVAQHLLTRWLTADRNRLCRHLRSPQADPWTAGPTNFEPAIRERLHALANAR